MASTNFIAVRHTVTGDVAQVPEESVPLWLARGFIVSSPYIPPVTFDPNVDNIDDGQTPVWNKALGRFKAVLATFAALDVDGVPFFPINGAVASKRTRVLTEARGARAQADLAKYDALPGSKALPRFNRLGPLLDLTFINGNPGKGFWPTVQRMDKLAALIPGFVPLAKFYIWYGTDHVGPGADGVFLATTNDLSRPVPLNDLRGSTAPGEGYRGKVWQRGNLALDPDPMVQASTTTQSTTFSGVNTVWTQDYGVQSETPDVIVNYDAPALYGPGSNHPDTVLAKPFWMKYQLKGNVIGKVAGQTTHLATSSDGVHWTPYMPVPGTGAARTNGRHPLIDYRNSSDMDGGGHTGYRRWIRSGTKWLSPGLGGDGYHVMFESDDGVTWSLTRKHYGQSETSAAGMASIVEDIIVMGGREWGFGRYRNNTGGGGSVGTGVFIAGTPGADKLTFSGQPQVILQPANGPVTVNGRSWVEAGDAKNICVYHDPVDNELWVLYQTDSFTVLVAKADFESPPDKALAFAGKAGAAPWRSVTGRRILPSSTGPVTDSLTFLDTAAPSGHWATTGTFTAGRSTAGGVPNGRVTSTQVAGNEVTIGYAAGQAIDTTSNQLAAVECWARGWRFRVPAVGGGVQKEDVGITLSNTGRKGGCSVQQSAYDTSVTVTPSDGSASYAQGAFPELRLHQAGTNTPDVIIPIRGGFNLLGPSAENQATPRTVGLIWERRIGRILVVDENDDPYFAYEPPAGQWVDVSAMQPRVWARYTDTAGAVTAAWCEVRRLDVVQWY